MATLHELRKNADYDIDDARYETQEFAQKSLLRADRIIRLLGECCKEPARTSIKEGISAYRRKISTPGEKIVAMMTGLIADRVSGSHVRRG